VPLFFGVANLYYGIVDSVPTAVQYGIADVVFGSNGMVYVALVASITQGGGPPEAP
jgi:hypothetical protein